MELFAEESALTRVENIKIKSPRANTSSNPATFVDQGRRSRCKLCNWVFWGGGGGKGVCVRMDRFNRGHIQLQKVSPINLLFQRWSAVAWRFTCNKHNSRRGFWFIFLPTAGGHLGSGENFTSRSGYKSSSSNSTSSVAIQQLSRAEV